MLKRIPFLSEHNREEHAAALSAFQSRVRLDRILGWRRDGHGRQYSFIVWWSTSEGPIGSIHSVKQLVRLPRFFEVLHGMGWSLELLDEYCTKRTNCVRYLVPSGRGT